MVNKGYFLIKISTLFLTKYKMKLIKNCNVGKMPLYKYKEIGKEKTKNFLSKNEDSTKKKFPKNGGK